VSTAELVLGDEVFDELLHSALTCLVIETSICGVCSLLAWAFGLPENFGSGFLGFSKFRVSQISIRNRAFYA
jgi:hypothetical protein